MTTHDFSGLRVIPCQDYKYYILECKNCDMAPMCMTLNQFVEFADMVEELKESYTRLELKFRRKRTFNYTDSIWTNTIGQAHSGLWNVLDVWPIKGGGLKCAITLHQDLDNVDYDASLHLVYDFEVDPLVDDFKKALPRQTRRMAAVTKR